MITLGVRFCASVSLESVEPRRTVSSSRTMRTTFCAGVSDSMTSAVRHFSLQRATKFLTTR